MNRTVLPELLTALRSIGENAARTAPEDITPEVLHAIGVDLDRVRRLLAAAGRTDTTCPEHPHGPVEPDSGGACLLCRIRSRRTQTAAGTADLEDVHGAVAEFGEEEATRRYGARAVTHALAAAGRGTHRYPPHMHPAAAGPETTEKTAQ